MKKIIGGGLLIASMALSGCVYGPPPYAPAYPYPVSAPPAPVAYYPAYYPPVYPAVDVGIGFGGGGRYRGWR